MGKDFVTPPVEDCPAAYSRRGQPVPAPLSRFSENTTLSPSGSDNTLSSLQKILELLLCFYEAFCDYTNQSPDFTPVASCSDGFLDLEKAASLTIDAAVEGIPQGWQSLNIRLLPDGEKDPPAKTVLKVHLTTDPASTSEICLIPCEGKAICIPYAAVLKLEIINDTDCDFCVLWEALSAVPVPATTTP